VAAKDELSARLLERLSDKALSGILKVEVRGAPAWYVRLGAKPLVTASLGAGEHPDVIVRGAAADLLAVLDGRMTLADGMVAERVSVSGDVAKIAAVTKRLAP
jgi:hypothetical protein